MVRGGREWVALGCTALRRGYVEKVQTEGKQEAFPDLLSRGTYKPTAASDKGQP